MTTETTDRQTASQRKAFRRWHSQNKEELNARRRERYANDPDYRKKARQRAADYRRSDAEGTAPPVFRSVKGKEVRVYRPSEVMEVCGRSTNKIPVWEGRGYIPPPTLDGTKRLYTEAQVKLVQQVSETIDQHAHSVSARRDALAKLTTSIHKKWKKAGGL